MPKNQMYKNAQCAYCGRNTGPHGQGEHVLPKNLYPSTTPTTLQYLKLPSCPTCNGDFSSSESHFRSVVVASGLNVTPERTEKWEEVKKGFESPRYGRQEREQFVSMMKVSDVIAPSGLPYFKMFPHKNPHVCKIVSKVARGLVYRESRVVIPSDLAIVTQYVECNDMPEEMRVVFEVPGAFIARTSTIHDNPLHDPISREMFRSFWHLHFFQTRFNVFILRVAPQK